MKQSYLKRFHEALKMEMNEHKSTIILYSLLRIVVIIVAILQFQNGNYENVFLCILTLLLFIVPSIIQVTFRIEIPKVLEAIILIFIFAAEILGEINNYYLIFPFWDTMLHTMNGFLAAAIGFSLVNLMNNEEKLEFKLSPLFVAVISFCFSMTIGVCWEMFEYGMDVLFNLDMQKDTIIHSISTVTLDPTKSNVPIIIDNIYQVMINGKDLGLGGYLDIGLIDTMIDLIVNFIGAFVFSLFGFFYLKKNNQKTVLKHFIPIKKDRKKDYLSKVFRK